MKKWQAHEKMEARTPIASRLDAGLPRCVSDVKCYSLSHHVENMQNESKR
jgi:hypothetical protein